MRSGFAAVLAGLCFFAASAFAGEVTITNGQTTWKSTHCVAPVIPPVLNGVGSEDAANDVNARVIKYNEYVKIVQGYMECLSSEAQIDATLASAGVTNAAQSQITEVRQRADALGMQLKK